MKLVATLFTNGINLATIHIRSFMRREMYKTIDDRKKVCSNERKRRAKVIS